MKMKKAIYAIMIGLTILSIQSCKKDELVGGTAVEKLAGDWYVKYSVDSGATYSDEYYHYTTYNTASNSSTEMWIDDLKSFYTMKGKINVDAANLTFSGSDIENTYDNTVKFNISGKILKDAAKASGTKSITDSIHFEVKFSDDPGTTYMLSGFKRTRFLEDEH
jgi:hypothetical protein